MAWTCTARPFRFPLALLLSLRLLLGLTPGRAQALPPSEGLVADSTELRVLRQFYYATGGPQWSNHTNWLQGTTAADFATWAGVQVQQGDVTGLSFYANGLVGTLPPCLGLLTQLQNITLPANQLTGALPASLGLLTQLQTLSLWQNRLSGPLPAELGQLRALQTLALNQNFTLSGPLPAELGQLTQLQQLNLNSNQLSGPIPAELGQLTALTYLDLYANQLTGPIPPALTRLSHLQTLALAVNHLTGPLPPELGQLSQLTNLQLWQNNWQDSIPAAWGQLQQLQLLNANQSGLIGRLPKELGQLTALVSLGLYGNQLTGPLPAGLLQLPHLQALNAEYNALSGPLPTAWSPALQELRLAFNQLSGALPEGLSESRQLWCLRLGYNHLAGPIPPSYGRLTELQEFWLGYNQLTGPLPDSLGQLQQVNYFDLAHNQLSGPLPALLGRCRRLSYLDLSYNQLSGPLPDSLRQLRALAQLRLNNNRFTGPLPASYGALGYSIFDVSSNQLKGSIPAGIGAPYLSLQNNQFSGALPASYAQSPTLTQLLVEGNNLTQLPVFTPALGTGLLQCYYGDNLLAFDSFEPNQAVPGVYQPWSAQRSPSPADTLAPLPAAGAPATLDGRIGGAHNHYQWQRLVGGQWVDMPGQSQPALSWSKVTPADAGSYRTQVTNDWVPGLTLYSRTHVLDVVPYRPLARNLPDDTNRPVAKAVPALAQTLHLSRDMSLTGDVNFVRSWSPRVALTDSSRVRRAPVDSVSASTQYLDGLGRPMQSVHHQASPLKNDLIQPQYYDGLGRAPYQLLPYAAAPVADHQGLHVNALFDQDEFYRRTTPPNGGPGPLAPHDPIQGVARTSVAYSETAFEASPLNRVVAQGAPGEAWRLTGGHATEHQQRPNMDADSVLWFTPGYDPHSLDPGYRGFYAAGELWGSQSRDEHGFYSLEWKDKLGQVVLKQVQTARLDSAGYSDSTGTQARRWLRTAYVYDDFGHLRFVLQPEGVKALLAGLATVLPPPGSITREQWDNVPGTAVSAIPLATPPTSTSTLTSLEGPTNIADNYGDRTRGFLVPPLSGDYTFWIAGDDNCELWLSADADPAHLQRLAFVPGWTYPRQWTAFAQQQSAPVQLVAGQRYALLVLHKEGDGGDALAVTWRRPDGTGYGEPIPGAYLAPYTSVVSRPIAPYLFHYRYDARGRQIAKQVPGQEGETLVVYDQLDRPVLSQDAAQRQRQEWSWTKYDALGRIVLSGLTTRQDTLGQVSLQAIASADTTTSHQYEQRTPDAAHYPQYVTTDQSFPQLGQNGFSAGPVLSVTRYDDYDFNGDGQADVAYDPSTDSQFPSGQAPVADALRTQGMVTQTSTRVLGVASGDSQQMDWLTTTTFYDERARPVQVQTNNSRKNLLTKLPYQDLLTTQLDFPGQVVQSVAVHQGPSHEPVTVAEFFTYDHTGRVLSTHQQLPGEARPALLDSVSYNELGQVTRKSLATGRLRQDVDYAYNIRGWLTSLNDPYQPNPAKKQPDLFSLSLHYEQGFTSGYEQYNGNLTGQTWRGRDGVQRAYGYVYDATNRLLQGDFVARQTTSAATPTAGAWKAEEDNYRLSFVSYDDNGNILTLRRRGLLQNATHASSKQYGAVDNLSYAYQGNRLLAVDDAVSGNQLPRPKNYNGAPTSLAGDFQEAGVKLGEEYLYDANGNLTQDKNKGITGILYNHLNLPRQIHFGQVGDSVVFRYAASGQKVAKLVYQTGKPTPLRTDYLGPYQYEQDSLKFFPHAEGRVLRFVSYDAAGQAKVSYQREFTFKDHLGNLRLAYRAGQTRTYLASLEQDDNTRKRETQQFDSLSVSPPIAVATPYTYGGGTYAARLNAGGASPQPLGPLTQLTVQKGDTLRVLAPGLYPQKVSNSSFAFSLATFVASLVQPAPAGSPSGVDGSRRGGLPLLQLGLGAGVAALPQLSGGVPKGYLRVLVFNQDSALIDQRTLQLTQAALGNYEVLDTQWLPITQNGYVTVYVGNESAADVYFDELRIEHRQGLQVQETQYDPAGLELAGLAAPSPGIRGLNNYRFNGKEFQMDLGLAWNHQDWRFFDPQLLRWHVGDPELENGQESWTPYSFGYDNAVRYADANGREPGDPPGKNIMGHMIFGTAVSLVNLNGQMWAGLTGARTKVAADFVYNKEGFIVDYDIHKSPVGTNAQELKSFALDEANVFISLIGARAGGGALFEQAGSKAAAGEAVQEARSVYRGLTKEDAESLAAGSGISARAPNANNSAANHVAGGKISRWISTTKLESRAANKFNRAKEGYVEIDLNKVPSDKVDVSKGVIGAGRRINNFAKSDQEVLIEKHIPQEAITRHVK